MPDLTRAKDPETDAQIAARLADPPGRGDLRDLVYGAIDGAVTTFAIVAGVQGAGLSTFIILALGFANVLADGFSMAAGNYMATKAELDNIQRIRRLEEELIRADPDHERRELRAILAQKGLSGDTLEDATRQIALNRQSWISMILDGVYGLGSADPHPMRAALVTFAAFLVAGMVPLLPFLLPVPEPFATSAIMTLAAFFGIGTLKSRWSLAPWWRSGAETLLIGGTAAALAYFVGTLFG